MRVLEEELAVKEEHWLQKETRLQGLVSSLQQELRQEREQHSQEVQPLYTTLSPPPALCSSYTPPPSRHHLLLLLISSLSILANIVILAVPVIVRCSLHAHTPCDPTHTPVNIFHH